MGPATPSSTARLVASGLARVRNLVMRIVASRYYLQRRAPLNTLPDAALDALSRACDTPRGWKLLLDLNRVHLLATVVRQIEEDGVPGGVVELGVYQGRTAALLRALLPRRPLFLFDTFQGFVASDIAVDPMLANGVSAQSLSGLFTSTSLARVKVLVGEAGDTRYCVGRFPDSTAGFELPEHCCLIHIDCDLYEPTLAALERLFPRLAPGGFLIVHDYANPHWKGVRAAVDAFFSGRAERPLIWPDSGGSACLRRHAIPSPRSEVPT